MTERETDVQRQQTLIRYHYSIGVGQLTMDAVYFVLAANATLPCEITEIGKT